MIVKNISKKRLGSDVLISCDVIFEKSKRTETLWYRFRNKDVKRIEMNGSFAIPALLLVSMFLGENLKIDGEISKKLLLNTTKIMDLVLSWKLGFKRINIVHDGFTKSQFVNKNSASFFSMGVDSFYTYLKHKKTVNRISNLIFTHGFDIDLLNDKFYRSSFNRLKHIASSENVDAIQVKTNIKSITDKYLEWDWEHGGAMASIAILLSNKFGKIYFAGSDSWTQRKKIMPYGTHPDLDKLWSTESLSIIHDGNEATRFQKIKKYISVSKIALDNLRVCNQNLKGKYNCSNCEKCIRTMIDLQINDALLKAKTFKNFIPFKRLERIHNEDFDTKIYFEDSLEELKKRHIYPELQSAIEKSLHLSNNPSITTRIVKLLSKLDKKYNRRRLFKVIFSLKPDGDRNAIFKILSKLSIIR